MEQLFAYNDLELYDLKSNPLEMNNLANSPKKYTDIIQRMNEKLNVLVANEAGEDEGQMLPSMKGNTWKLSPSFKDLRL